MSEVVQNPAIDSRGNIHIHAREGLKLAIYFQDAAGAGRDVTGLPIYFEVEGEVRKALDAGDTADQRYLVLTRAEVAALHAPSGNGFVLIDESQTPEEILWEGELYVDGWTTAP